MHDLLLTVFCSSAITFLKQHSATLEELQNIDQELIIQKELIVCNDECDYHTPSKSESCDHTLFEMWIVGMVRAEEVGHT